MAVKGDGSIINRGKDKHGKTIWEVSLSLGRDPKTGKQVRKTAKVHGTKADAKRKRDEMRRDLDFGLRVDADKLRFGDFVADYMATRRLAATAQPETLDKQEKRLERIRDVLGNPLLKDMNAGMVQALYPRLRDAIVAGNGGKCSTTTLHGYHVALNSAMKYAVNHDLIVKNPCERVEAPRVAKSTRKAMDVGEAARLLAELDKAEAQAYAELESKEGRRRDPDAPRAYVRGLPDLSAIMAARVNLVTGMRLGETLALKWDCVDTVRGLVRVARGTSATGRVKEVKTDAGNRTIAIDRKTAEHLARWRDVQAGLLASIGAVPEWVACSQTGTRLGASRFNRWWNPFKAEHGFEGLKSHELRHTQATLLLANGVDVKTVQERMGHSSASITLDWYSHAIPENDRAAADLLGDVLEHGTRPKPPIRVLRTA